MSSGFLPTLLACAILAFPAAAQNKTMRDQAVRVCKSDIQQQVFDRFGAGQVSFPVISVTQDPNPNGRISGTVRIGAGDARLQQFTCSANFLTGQVTSVRLQGAVAAVRSSPPVVAPSPPVATRVSTEQARNTGEAARELDALAIENCQAAADGQIRGSGYGNVRFGSTNIANRPDGEHVWGTARAGGWDRSRAFSYRSQTFSYGCTVDANGNVVSSNVGLTR